MSECDFCGSDFNPLESDANFPETYCSDACEQDSEGEHVDA